MIKLMNSAMMPVCGIYTLRQMSRNAFVTYLRDNEFESYIGYPDTARLIEEISGVAIPVSRAQTTLEDGDVMLIAKLKYRVNNPHQKGRFTPSMDDFEFFHAMYND